MSHTPQVKKSTRSTKSTTNQATSLDEQLGFLRLPDVMAFTGLPKSSIYALIRQRDFLAPIRLAPRTVAWVRAEILVWAEKRIKASRLAR
jgi:prophage regulatory protein